MFISRFIFSRYIILFNLIAVSGLWAVREYSISSNAKSLVNVLHASPNSMAGPDVIVGDLYGVSRYTQSGNTSETAFAIGTISCNIGSARLDWIQNSPLHPVISQNLYRVKNGRIEMIGMSWLKHGFSVAAGSTCDQCTDPASNYLGVGCSDPYGSSLNGSQSGLGPRSQVNAVTGVFPWPKGNLPSSPGGLGGRIRVLNSEINPSLNSGARYFAESQYIHPQDAASGNDNNNASYREIFPSAVSGGFTIAFGAPLTVREQAAIYAWKSIHPDVKIFAVDVPNDGRILVGIRTTPIAGGYHTEVAVENLNSHQSVRSMRLGCGSNAITNAGFRDIDYQFEPYSGADWAPAVGGNAIEWSTQTFAANANANAIRWNTLYSFWCDSVLPPTNITLGMFRPGTASEMNINLVESVVHPESFKPSQGAVVSGQYEDILKSDDQYLELRPDYKKRSEKIVEARFNAESLSSNLFEFAVRLETAAVNANAGDILQTVELFNLETGLYEVIDERTVGITDQTLRLSPIGDWSRFIESGTNQVDGKIVWKVNPAVRRLPTDWSVEVDELALLMLTD